MSSFPIIPAGQGLTLADETTGEFESAAVKAWLAGMVGDQIATPDTPGNDALVAEVAAQVSETGQKSTAVQALGPLIANLFKSPRGTQNLVGTWPTWVMSAQGGGTAVVSLEPTGWEDGSPCARIDWSAAPTNTWLALAISNVTEAYVPGEVYSFSTQIRPSWSGRFRTGVQWYTAAGAYISNTVGLAADASVFPNHRVTELTVSTVAPDNAGYARIMIQQSNDDTPFYPGAGAHMRLRAGLVHKGMGPVPYVDPAAATGYPTGTIDQSASRFAPYTHEPRLVCIGDSLTYGTGGGSDNFPNQLQTLLDRRVLNLGYPGETSVDIASRLTSGFLVTFPGGTVPASGSVNVTLTHMDGTPVTTAMKVGVTRIRYVMCAGATWTLDWSGSSYRLTRSIAAGSSSSVIGPQIAVTDQSIMYRGDTQIIWAGRNDYADTADVQASIRALVGNLTRNRFLVLGILNGTAEPDGDPDYDQIVALNTALAREYAGRFVDVRRGLIDDGLEIAGITPTGTDTTNIGDDVVPDSLRSDAIHLNADGYEVVATLVAARLRALNYA